MLRKILLILVVLFAAIQLFPVSRTNPTTGSEFVADHAVKGVFKRACFDCHSHETRWPWYSYVAPASWLVARDVKEGREHLNFSEWRKYSPKDQAEKRAEIWEEVEKGNMPIGIYLNLHSDARLTEADLQQIKLWSQTAPNPVPQSSLGK